MSLQKNSTHLILIFLVILGCIYTQRISIPLYFNKYENLMFYTRYGTRQCAIQVIPILGYCSHTIYEQHQNVEQCGVTPVIQEIYNKQYVAPFQLSNILATLQFSVTIWGEEQYRQNQLCFGFKSDEDQRNSLTDLLQAGQIREERVYFSLNGLKNKYGIIGEIDIGAPNQSLIKKGVNFVELKRRPEKFATNSAILKENIKFFKQQLDSPSIIDIRLDSPFHRFPIKTFQQILSIFDKQGIQYTYQQSFSDLVKLPSIKQLKKLQIPLTQKDNTEFLITIKPSQYTRQLDDGQYQLLIQPQQYASKISLGYTIFETYYVGFDLPNLSIVIAEKAEQQDHNLRGSLNISE